MLKLFSESVDAWRKKYGSANLMDMLKDVTYKMSENSYFGPKEYKIVPSIVHKLRKDVIFTPGRKWLDVLECNTVTSQKQHS